MPSLSQRFPSRTLLHRGDLALSYKARDVTLDRDVFIKIVNPLFAKDTEIRARFEREAKAVARLDHPNLVRIYEYGEDADEGLYMLLEWVEGQNLSDFLKTRKTLLHDELQQLAHDLLSGVGALHSVGILHRDLKPDNILVSPPRIVGGIMGGYKITDFSLASLKDAPLLTHHTAIVGTPAYMSPEQASGGKPTEQSDLFSLGVVLYEAVTGNNPVIGETMLDTLRRIRESDISFEHSAFVNLPYDLRLLIESLLRKNPQERPTGAKDALKFLNGETAIAPIRNISSSRRNFYYATLAAAVVIIGAYFIIQPGSTKEEPKRIANTLPKVTDTTKIKNDEPEFRSSLVEDSTEKPILESKPVIGLPKSTAIEKSPTILSKPAIFDTQAVASIVIPDSMDLMITTEPWAHVFLNGTQVGTTPLANPLRISSKQENIILRNPAYPPIELPFSKSSGEMHVELKDYVAQLIARVEPWGEIYVDGEHLGTAPLNHPLYLSPGIHLIRFTHPEHSAVQREVTATAGQSLNVHVNLNDGNIEIAQNSMNGQ